MYYIGGFYIMKYYSTKKVTEILGVTAQTLRNWDKEGKLKPSYVKSNGYRYYSEEIVITITMRIDILVETMVVESINL